MFVATTLFFGILLSVTSIAMLVVLTLDRRRRARQRRVLRALHSDGPEIALPRRSPAAAAIKAAGKTEPTTLRGQIEARLVRAGVPLGAGGFGLLVAVAAVAMTLALRGMVALSWPPAMALGLLGAVSGAHLLLGVLATRRAEALVAQLPEALDAFARGLKAGRSIPVAFELVAANAQAPLQQEIAQCRDMLALGHDLPETLQALARRVMLPEVRFFAVATQLQAETGGNLVETVENLAAQLRERRLLRKKIRALSSEARASALILAALPFGIGLVLLVLNPGYLAPLVQDPRGVFMAGLGLLSLATGILVLFRMGRLDV